jgi:NAD(P)-dependent dehydrogenase (short-subunit alcohol dehydrogenase family)
MSVILITGASTGIGNLTARHLANAGHTVYASMRDPAGRNAEPAAQMRTYALETGTDLYVVALDVTSQASADAAVQTVIERHDGLDVVINNAGHLSVGYVEAFTDDDVTDLIDVNAVGAHRVNRAVLPHFRQRRAGVLMYVGSTIRVTTPPFMGPYVASKAAMDALAVVTAYEASAFRTRVTVRRRGGRRTLRRTGHSPARSSSGASPSNPGSCRKLSPEQCRTCAPTSARWL